ncbi:hypothetical protein JTB14_005690 [Gonioctena quinquepunctata]|nr:hypothetical protein JTB14_005690 [Gonioctena quinquepunctata]
MGKTIKLIQANFNTQKPHHNISSRFANELLDVALIWIKGPDRMNGWDNIAGKVMFHSSVNKPRACILLRRDITFRCSVNVVAAQLTIPTEEGQNKRGRIENPTSTPAPEVSRPLEILADNWG